MDAVLLDTDVFSFLLKGSRHAEPYRKHVRDKTPAISFITVGELYFWAEKRGWGPRKRADLETRLRSVVIVPFDLQVCQAYARVSALKTPSGSDRNIAANDRWIAACAIRHSLPLVTNNRRHFENIPDLTVISEAPPTSAPVDRNLPLGETPT